MSNGHSRGILTFKRPMLIEIFNVLKQIQSYSIKKLKIICIHGRGFQEKDKTNLSISTKVKLTNENKLSII